jgi:hypothetical protein
VPLGASGLARPRPRGPGYPTGAEAGWSGTGIISTDATPDRTATLAAAVSSPSSSRRPPRCVEGRDARLDSRCVGIGPGEDGRDGRVVRRVGPRTRNLVDLHLQVRPPGRGVRCVGGEGQG